MWAITHQVLSSVAGWCQIGLQRSETVALRMWNSEISKIVSLSHTHTHTHTPAVVILELFDGIRHIVLDTMLQLHLLLLICEGGEGGEGLEKLHNVTVFVTSRAFK